MAGSRFDDVLADETLNAAMSKPASQIKDKTILAQR